MKKHIVSFVSLLFMMLTIVPAVHAETDEKGPVNLPSRVAVPNVVGSRLVPGIQTLRAAGFLPVTQMSDRDGNARVIIRQEPAAGSIAMKGSSVNIYGQLVITDTDTKGRVTLPTTR
ncbi:MAG: PASTA domain-containing protein [Chlorobiaceae bacterium]|nr:PASTA domain-containing protein [Chlorobiaceae bacterium]NTV59804.1 PASTA domain-containing protein [Chlorobiaceae bacterium]